MVVRESFRSQLDIRYTSRVERQPSESDGAERQEIRLWTQGPRISFDRGHIFYDTSLGYQEWDRALHGIELVCVVVGAKPNDVVRRERGDEKGHENQLIDGFVEFELLKPNSAKTQLVTCSKHRKTQNEFVEFLIDGVL